MSQNRDVNDEDIGMRAFQLRKGKAVERAIERLRYALKSDWTALSDKDIEELEWLLGELWAYVARDSWDRLRFGKLTISDIRTMLVRGREMRAHTRNGVDVLQEVDGIISAKGE